MSVARCHRRSDPPGRNASEPATYCAKIVIHDIRKPGLSADDRQIAVLNTAFEAFSGEKKTIYGFYLTVGIDRKCGREDEMLAAGLLCSVLQLKLVCKV